MVMTALLFISSLILERLSSTPSDIPPPHSVSNIVGLIHTVLPLPKVYGRRERLSMNDIISVKGQ